MLDEKFYTTEQVANVLQVHPFTILKFIKQGKLEGIKIGRMYRIRESEVSRFLEERSTQPGKKRKKKEARKEEAPPQNQNTETSKKPEKVEQKAEEKSKESEQTTSTKSETKTPSYNLPLTDEKNNDGEHFYII